jgi:hypothetical protein
VSKPCTICSMPKRKRNQIDSALVEGKTYDNIARKFTSPERTVSRSMVFRHARHALAAPKGRRLHTASRELKDPPPTPKLSEAGKSLLERVESLLLESQAIAAEAKTERQWLSAIAGLREVRCGLELIGKLSGEIASANINFFNIDITQERALEFLLAAEQKGPHLIEYMRRQFGQRFGMPPPATVIEFLSPPGEGAGKTIITSHLEEAPPAATVEAEPPPPVIRPWDPNCVVRTR